MRVNILKMGFDVNETISRILVYLFFVCNEPLTPSIHLFNGSVFSCLCAESCVLLRQEILVALFRTRFLVVWEATASRLPSITMCSHLGRLVSMRLSVVNVEYLILSRFEPGYLYHDIQLMSFFFFIILFTFFQYFLYVYRYKKCCTVVEEALQEFCHFNEETKTRLYSVSKPLRTLFMPFPCLQWKLFVLAGVSDTLMWLKIQHNSQYNFSEKWSNSCTGLSRPWGFQEAEASRFQDSLNMKVVLSALRTDCLYSPGNIPGTYFRKRLSQTQGHSAAGRMSMKNSNDNRESNPRPSSV
jgi:hypothetical protein